MIFEMKTMKLTKYLIFCLYFIHFKPINIIMEAETFAEKLLLVVHEKNRLYKEIAQREKVQNEKSKKEVTQKTKIIKEFTQERMANELEITRYKFKIKLDNNEFTEAEMGKLAKLLGYDFNRPSFLRKGEMQMNE